MAWLCFNFPMDATYTLNERLKLARHLLLILTAQRLDPLKVLWEKKNLILEF